VGNALEFFVACCEGQGLEYITESLGDPFATVAPSDRKRTARMTLGSVLLRVIESRLLDPRSEWSEYVASCVLADLISDDDASAGLPTDALRFVVHRQDPRARAVVQKLIVAGAYEDEDVVPSLVLRPGEESLEVATDLRAWCQAAGREASRDKSELKRIVQLVEEAMRFLKA
jgi:hypothetical protein